ncbi:MAG: hypothetical protein A2417_09350 [Bdellovibrionales bacterium RIFOXYC1_FULL_37_79]|nr:MAG: hypothetical protein A2181_03275 [Bdellovibrionales bacterium RIFOXYA1_FULL_38_20]OFZ51453.1 MAG: hypothetical protein A2417_09350 [Bdellovibrionales bacterium RIFOXYC1_FULL_37_79]
MSKQYYTFFLIIPPGLEDLAKLELLEKTAALPETFIKEIRLEKGGISIETTLSVGFSLNLTLKIPTRILLRLDEFKCRDFPRLFKKISRFKWATYLNQPLYKIHVSSQTSRLLNTKKIEQTVTLGILQYFKANTPTKKMLLKKIDKPPQIFLRVVNDLVTLSIDTTGTRLNIRNYRTNIGFAPIRENIAAALVLALGSLKNTHLVDPMCGSGTFLLEAAGFYLPSTRNFAFTLFNLPPESDLLLPIPGEHAHTSFLSYTGLDINDRAIETSQNNFKNLKQTAPIHFFTHDLFLKRTYKLYGNLAVITNPPYGKRIIIKENLIQYYQKIMDAIYHNYTPQVVGIVIPQNINYKKINFKNYLIKEIITFSNGGIKVNFLVLHKD